MVLFADSSLPLLPMLPVPYSKPWKGSFLDSMAYQKAHVLAQCQQEFGGSESIWGLISVDHTIPLQSRSLSSLDFRGCSAEWEDVASL